MKQPRLWWKATPSSRRSPLQDPGIRRHLHPVGDRTLYVLGRSRGGRRSPPRGRRTADHQCPRCRSPPDTTNSRSACSSSFRASKIEVAHRQRRHRALRAMSLPSSARPRFGTGAALCARPGLEPDDPWRRPAWFMPSRSARRDARSASKSLSSPCRSRAPCSTENLGNVTGTNRPRGNGAAVAR